MVIYCFKENALTVELQFAIGLSGETVTTWDLRSIEYIMSSGTRCQMNVSAEDKIFFTDRADGGLPEPVEIAEVNQLLDYLEGLGGVDDGIDG